MNKRTRSIAAVTLAAMLVFAGGCESAPSGDLSQTELLARIEQQTAPLIIDVRTEEEFIAAHIPGAINIPHTQISQRLEELPQDLSTEIVVHCKSGTRAASALNDLTAAGYQNVRMLDGHFASWSQQDLPVAQGVTR